MIDGDWRILFDESPAFNGEASSAFSTDSLRLWPVVAKWLRLLWITASFGLCKTGVPSRLGRGGGSLVRSLLMTGVFDRVCIGCDTEA